MEETTIDRKTLMQAVHKRTDHFKLSDEQVFHIIELSEKRAQCKSGTWEYEHAREDLIGYMNELSEREKQELMCLMDFGRNIDYIGFCRDTVMDFLEKVDTGHFRMIRGRNAVEYVSGKKPLGKWLRLVETELISEKGMKDFYRIVFYNYEERKREGHVDFKTLDEAWTGFREFLSSDTAAKCSGMQMRGYSLIGQAELIIATVNFH